MKFLFTLLLTFSYVFSYAQINKDSLFILLMDETKDASVRLEAFREFASNEILYSHPQDAIQLAKISVELAKRKEFSHDIAFGLFCLGVAHNNLGETEPAILYQNQSIAISQEISDTTMLTKALNNLGNIYLNKSDFVNAIDYYRQCQKLLEEKGDKKGIAACKNNIGLVLHDLEDNERALIYLNEAHELYDELGQEISQTNVLINIGTVYRFQKKYDEALEYYQRALDLKQKNNVKYGLGTCYSNIGLIHRAKGDDEKAMQYIKLSTQVHLEMSNKKGITRNLIYFADLHFSKDKDSTIFYANRALDLAIKSNHSEEITDAAELLSKTYESLGNYKEAMKMQTLYRNTRDSIYDVKSQYSVLIREYMAKYENETKDRNIEKEIKWIQFKKLGAIFLGLIFITILYFVFYIKKRKKQNMAERKKLLLQIKVLKEKLISQTVSSPLNDKKALSLDKSKIEKAINSKLGESSWMILNLIFNNPSISNKEIAAAVSLSLEGVSSSLRRMYQAFGITSSSNKKITLIMTATRFSFENE